MRRPGRRRGPERVLVIGHAIPGADSSAGEQRIIRMAAMLATRAAVDMVAVGSPRPVDEPARIRALRNHAGVHVPYGGGPVHLVRLLRGPRYALILVESWSIAELVLPLVRRHQPEAVCAVDSIDLHFLRDARRAELVDTPDPSRERRMARELSTYHAADIRIFVSDVERQLYEGVSGSRTDRNVVIPIIVDPSSVARAPRPGEVVFVGGLWHAPNMDGVSWFCCHVWPRIRETCPDAKLRLVGSNAWSLPIDAQVLSGAAGVAIEGFVADLDAVYARACVAIAPLRFGAGMKGKVCEAMAAGVPVVATSVGAEGIEARPSIDLMVADDPGSFARAVVSLLGDDAQAAAVGTSGAAAIQAQCGADVVRPAVLGLLGGGRSDVPSPAPSRRRGELARRAVAAGWRGGRRLHALSQRATSSTERHRGDR